MKKSFFLKTILLGFTMFSLSGCGGETSSSESTSTSGSVVSTSASSSSEGKIVNNHKPGDNITITKDNFFNFFHFNGSNFGCLYSNLKYNIESEIKATLRTEYYCPILSDKVDSYSEQTLSSSTVSDKQYLDGESSHFISSDITYHFEKPTAWGDNQYSTNTYKYEFEFIKINGIVTFGVLMSNAELIELNKTNYSPYFYIDFHELTYHGDKTIIKYEFCYEDDNKLFLLIENFKVEFEYVTFDQNYSKIKTTSLSTNSLNLQTFEFEKAVHWRIEIKSISGLLYGQSGYSDER